MGAEVGEELAVLTALVLDCELKLAHPLVELQRLRRLARQSAAIGALPHP